MLGGAVVMGWGLRFGVALLAVLGACEIHDDPPPIGLPGSGPNPSGGVSSFAGRPNMGGSGGGTAVLEGGAGGDASDGGAAPVGGEATCGRAEQECCAHFACEAGLSCRGGICLALTVSDFGEPCRLDAECVGGLCLPDAQQGARCTATCNEAQDCLKGWDCTEVAAPVGKACSCEPGAETCNGLDDDCNGVIDDDATTQPLCAAALGDGAQCADSGECICSGLVCDGLCVDELNDPQNCGACGTRCRLGCSAGECIVPSAVAMGQERACTLLSDGTVRCWGFNNGALGNGGNLDLDAPTPIPIADVVQLDLGRDHGCAVLGNGTLRCWGTNGAGQLGIGLAGGGLTPTLVTSLSGVVHVATGEQHTCAVLEDGLVWCWGFNLEHQVGVASPNFLRSPVEVVGVSGAEKVALGDGHSCALLGDGTVECWGLNDQGQLGDETNASRYSPAPVSGLTGVVDLVAGAHHTCALLDGGTAACWGSNLSGQIGDGTNENRDAPTPVLDLTGVTALAAGGSVTVAATAQPYYRAWGKSSAGASPMIDSKVADTSLELGKVGAAVDANDQAACSLYADEPGYCWGIGLPARNQVRW